MTDSTPLSQPPPKLLDQVRDRLRLKHYSIRTEAQYVHWIRRFILFHDKRHPANMGAVEVEAFLTYLAVVGRVAASTQNQALSALLYLYREVLSIELPWLDNVVRAKTQQRLSVVLTRQEVNAVLNGMSEVYALMARLLYETGMRLMESMRLGARMIYTHVLNKGGAGWFHHSMRCDAVGTSIAGKFSAQRRNVGR
jgi:integrase